MAAKTDSKPTKSRKTGRQVDRIPVLLVDDDSGIRKILKRELRRKGIQVTACLLYTSDAADE